MYSQTVLSAISVFVFGAILMVIIPGILGAWSIPAIPIAAASALIFFGLTIETTLGVILASILLEMFAGLPLGSYATAIAVSALLLMLAGNIIRVESLKSLSRIEPSSIFSELLVAYALVTVIFIISYVVMVLAYGYGWSWTAMTREFFNVRVFVESILGILFSWICWRGVQHLTNLRRDKW
jgi:hypothetical protein